MKFHVQFQQKLNKIKSRLSFLELNHVTHDVEHPIKVYDCEDGNGTIHHVYGNKCFVYCSRKYQEKWSINNIIPPK